MIKPGTYKATVLNHDIRETKTGTAQASITFSFDCDGPQQLTWYGSFSDKGTPHTIKTLLVCGLKGPNPSGPLDVGREVLITIREEQGLDGKPRMRVGWVNAVRSTRNILSPERAKARLAELEGAVAAARQEFNIPDQSDVIPF